jgi:hypothetical protein
MKIYERERERDTLLFMLLLLLLLINKNKIIFDLKKLKNNLFVVVFCC